VSGFTATEPDEDAWVQRSSRNGRSAGFSPGGTEVPDNIVLIMRFHPVHGEDFSVICGDFGTESEALEAIAHALDGGRSLVLTRARYDRAADENGVVINLANVVSVRLSKTDSAATGQYL
jgi:hypothetical protein